MNKLALLCVCAAAVLSGCGFFPSTPATPPNVVGAWKGQFKTSINTTINFTLNVRNQVERSFDCDLVVNATSYPCSAGYGSIDSQDNTTFSTVVDVPSQTEFLGLTLGAILNLSATVSGQSLTAGKASLSAQGSQWETATFTADR